MIDQVKAFLKKFMIIRYTEDGGFHIFLKIPIKINAAVKYRFFYAPKPVVSNKIVFDNYMGKAYGCNPKYIAEELLRTHPGEYDLVWVVSKDDKKNAEFPEGIRTVTYNSSQAYQEYATAKVWVSNYHKITYVKRGLRKKKDQYFIQTWHGSLGIKRIENDVPLLQQDANWLKLAKLSSEMVDYWISNSKFETDIYKRAFWNVDHVLEYGHPRNDVMFGEKASAARERVIEHYEIRGKKILFYAPTFREDYRLDCYEMDFAGVKEALEMKFGGDWVILVRLHPRVRKHAKKVIPDEDYIIDSTRYPDIQELVAAADSMITDYSSCIFDFMLTRRPGFLFATDKEEYVQERGFYYPLESTPFPIAQDNKELVKQILEFDGQKYKTEVEKFLLEKGCVEDGKASEKIAQKIAELTDVS